MVVCCICGIEWVPEGVSFHKFPKSDNIRKRWLAAINKEITNFVLSTNSKICGQHFTTECFTVTETGRRYLKSYTVPSIFNMPLKKKYILTQTIQTSECNNGITEEPCSEIIINTDEVEDNLQKPCVFIVKDQNLTELDTLHSEILDIPIINEEVINEDQQQIQNEEYKVIANNNNKKSCPEMMNINENRTNLRKSHSSNSSIRRRYTTNRILDISLVNKKLINAQRRTEECNEILRKKLKTSQQKCRRLQRKVTFLALLIKHLQDEKLSQDNTKSLKIISE